MEELLWHAAGRHRLAVVVHQGSAGAPHHLEDIGDREVGVSVLGAVVELRVHQHDEVRLRGYIRIGISM